MAYHVTDLLTREHRLAARLLDAFELLIERHPGPDADDKRLVRELLRFFERAVDGLHQDKEERVLFTQLLARSAHARVPLMRHFSAHHRRERRLLRELGEELEAFGQWDRSNDPFVTHARVYLRLQRRHMLEEQEQLFPVVRQALDPEAEGLARAGFRRVEHAHGFAFEPEALELLGRLTDHLGEVPPSADTGALDREPGTLRRAQ